MVLTISLIASIESLLTASAIDKNDPFNRHSNMDKELVAKGFGNFILGGIGGLPIIAEVVRSSANISNGAKTRWSNFFHGLFLQVFVLLLPNVIHMIPLASLAGILIMVGVRLASPSEFYHTYKTGWDQILVFSVTLILTIVEDLLVGVAAGIITKLLVQVYFGVPITNLFVCRYQMNENANEISITVEGALLFSNLLNLKRTLQKLPLNRKIIVHVENVEFIGFSAFDFLSDFKRDYEKEGGSVSIVGLENLHPLANHELSSRTRRHI